LSDLPVKREGDDLETRQPDELVIEALDEQSLRGAHERNAARLRLLWDNRRFLIRAAAWGLVLAFLIAFLIPKRYQSTARLMPPDQTGGTGAAMLAALSSRTGSELTSLAASAMGMKTTGDLFIGIVNSETAQDDLIQKFNLQEVYGKRYIEDARKALAAHTDTSEDQKSGIIIVSVTDHDRHRAAAMAQEYVNELNWVVSHLSTSSARRERIFLDQRLEQVKSDLETAERQFSQFASQKGAIDIPSQGKAMVEAAATLQGQMIAAQSELEAYRQIYTDKNVRVQALQARVNELQQALEKLSGQGASETSSADQLYPSLRQLPLLGVTYADLLRRTKVEEAVFETLTQEDELAKVEEAKEIPTVRVLDPPTVPDKKSFPPRLLIVVLGTMLGFVVGACWVFGNAAWAATDPGDPHKALAIEVWSSVHSSLPWNSQNGSPNGGPRYWLQNRFRRRHEGNSGE
jgi:uncharacterized protein involved in exopolysaccharide biosynthesis